MVRINWTNLVEPTKAAICFTQMVVYYNVKSHVKNLWPGVVNIKDFCDDAFHKATINIEKLEDLEPIYLPLCGNDRNRVLVFELWLTHRYREQRYVELKELDKCRDQPPIQSNSNCRCKTDPLVFAVGCLLNFLLKRII